MQPNPINEFSTATPQAVGRFSLQGQCKPDYLVVLAGVVVSANLTAKRSAGDFDRLPTEAHLAQLIEDEQHAQDAEALYLQELSDWHDRQQWAHENAQEQTLEHGG